MKFNNKKKILSIFFASIISSSAIATATYSIVSTKKNENNFETKSSNEPILGLDQTLNLNSEKNINELKKYFLEYYDYLFIDERISFFRNKLNLNDKITKSLDVMFKEIINSNEFKKLETNNDWNQIKNEFKNICNSSYNFFPRILSQELKWDEEFTYLLINTEINNNIFNNVFNEFYNMQSKDYYKKTFNESINSMVNNEKLKWIFEKTNTTKKDLETISHKYAEQETKSVFDNVSLYQEFLIKKYNIMCHFYHEDTNINYFNFYKAKKTIKYFNLNIGSNEIIEIISFLGWENIFDLKRFYYLLKD